jgi:murein DD-endopeptidase MepM/ murein hydrolase activator NlpD
MRLKIAIVMTLVAALLTELAPTVVAQGLHARIQQRLNDSANQNASAEQVRKGKEVLVPRGYDNAFDAAVQVLKAQGLTIASASKDVGQIETELQLTRTRRPKQHAIRYLIDLRKVSDKETGIRVVALEQVRTYVLVAEPWEPPLYDAEASDALTKAIVEATNGPAPAEQAMGPSSGASAPAPQSDSQAGGGILTNADVIKLSQAGLEPNLIITTIKAAPQVNFTLSTADLIALRHANVNQEVITAMMNRATHQAIISGGTAMK